MSATRSAGLAVRPCTPVAEAGAGAGDRDAAGDGAAAAEAAIPVRPPGRTPRSPRRRPGRPWPGSAGAAAVRTPAAGAGRSWLWSAGGAAACRPEGDAAKRAAGLNPAHILDVIRHLVLPCLTLVLVIFAQYQMIMRSSVIDELGSPYLVTARAKGLRDAEVRRRHAVPNALLPSVTVIFLQVGTMISGAIVVETVYSWPGLGYLTYQALQIPDLPLLEGTFIIFSASVIVFNLLADLLYRYLDPRVRRNDRGQHGSRGCRAAPPSCRAQIFPRVRGQADCGGRTRHPGRHHRAGAGRAAVHPPKRAERGQCDRAVARAAQRPLPARHRPVGAFGADCC